MPTVPFERKLKTMASTNPPCVHSPVWVEFGFDRTKRGEIWACEAEVSPSRPVRLPGCDHGAASPARSAVPCHRLPCSDVALLPLSRTGHWALPYSVGNSCARQPCGGWRRRSCWLRLCCNAGACPPCPPGSSWVLGEREGGWPAWRAFSQVGDQAVHGGVGGDGRLMLSAYKIIVVPKFWYCIRIQHLRCQY